jgi:hypothetical protein
VEGEKTSLKILKGIGRLEGSDVLSTETIQHVMMNDGLRSRLQPDQTPDEEYSLIRDALVEEKEAQVRASCEKAEDLKTELSRQSEIAMNLAAEKIAIEESKFQVEKQKQEQGAVALQLLEEKNRELSKIGHEKVQLASNLEQEQVLRAKENSTARAEIAAQHQEIAQLAADKSKAEAEATIKDQTQLRRTLKIYYWLSLSLVVSLSFVFAYVTPRVWPELARYLNPRAMQIFAICCLFPLGHLLVERFFRKQPAPLLPWPLSRLQRFRTFILSVVVLGFLAGVGGNI